MKKNILIGSCLFLSYGQIALAEFQSTNKQSSADLPTTNTLNEVFHFVNVGLALTLILSLLLLIASGVSFLTAGGDEGVLDNAHKMWRLSVLGLVVSLVGYVIVNLIKYFT